MKIGDILFSWSLHKGYCFFWDVTPCSSMHIYHTYLLKNHVNRKFSKVSSATNVAIVVTSINTEQVLLWVRLHTQLIWVASADTFKIPFDNKLAGLQVEFFCKKIHHITHDSICMKIRQLVPSFQTFRATSRQCRICSQICLNFLLSRDQHWLFRERNMHGCDIPIM